MLRPVLSLRQMDIFIGQAMQGTAMCSESGCVTIHQMQ